MAAAVIFLVGGLFLIDVLAEDPVEATVIETQRDGGAVVATVAWVGDDGTQYESVVTLPTEYQDRSVVPVRGAFVVEKWFPASWYVVAALFGLLVGGPVAWGLRPKDYSGERPIRMVGSGMGQ